MEYTQDPKIPENVRLNDHMNIAKEAKEVVVSPSQKNQVFSKVFEKKVSKNVKGTIQYHLLLIKANDANGVIYCCVRT